MPTFRDSIRPIIAIIIAAIILMVLLIPLSPIEWTMGAETTVSEAADGRGFSILMIVGPLIKIMFLMGIPALITLGVRRLIGRFRKS